ncbi:MAG: non-canonical purine NTP pyrophosphatase [Patescibacteria group bacterium]
MNIILATRNKSKAAQIQATFAGSPFKVITLDETHIEGEVVENGGSLHKNARLKAAFAREKSNGKFWTMSEDTGIFINTLEGQPGVEAAYWGGKLTDIERMNYCLRQMEGKMDRSAKFETIAVLISPDGVEHSFSGEVQGTILQLARCAPQPKMPYSSVFQPNGYTKTWAEMTIDEENAISHRGKAFLQARLLLESKLAVHV